MADRLALNGGAPVRNQPFHPWPVHDKEQEETLLRVLRSGK